MINNHTFKWKHSAFTTQVSDLGINFNKGMFGSLGETSMWVDVCSNTGFPLENLYNSPHSSSEIGVGEYLQINEKIPLVSKVG